MPRISLAPFALHGRTAPDARSLPPVLMVVLLALGAGACGGSIAGPLDDAAGDDGSATPRSPPTGAGPGSSVPPGDATQPTSFDDGGTAPPLGDAGSMADAGGPTRDGGSRPIDAGSQAADAGVPKFDAGTPAKDAGPSTSDAGGSTTDAGVAPFDAGLPGKDGGSSVVDAGQPLPGSFVHPGILVNKAQLDFVKAKIAAGAQPWKGAFDQLKSSFLGKLTYTTQGPVPVLMCSTSSGISAGVPQAGCTEINNDSAAVYAQALLWYFTGDATYAQNAIDVINAWSSTLQSIPFDQPRLANGEQAYWQNLLVAGWSAESMLRGAEIIRYTSPLWKSVDIARAETMFRTLYLPLVKAGWTGGGNGAMTWAEAVINIGIFTNDRTTYLDGVTEWRSAAKALVYLNRDGTHPAYPYQPGKTTSVYGTPDKLKTLWGSPTAYLEGLERETCRDLGHTFMGLGAMANSAETARIQGTDLYGDPEYKDRFLAGWELNADYVNQMLDQMAATGMTATQLTATTWAPSRNWVCPDFKDGGGSAFLGSELTYNHFANRLGIAMPNTKLLLERKRPQPGGNHLFFETLTHYGAP